VSSTVWVRVNLDRSLAGPLPLKVRARPCLASWAESNVVEERTPVLDRVSAVPRLPSDRWVPTAFDQPKNAPLVSLG